MKPYALLVGSALAVAACSTGGTERCLAGQEVASGNCLDACGDGQERVDGTCVPQCVSPNTRLDGKCVGPKAIRVNSLGYVPSAFKRAVLVKPPDEPRFEVRTPDGETAYVGSLTGPSENPDTEEMLFAADFSDFTTPGRYELYSPGVGSSAPFEIGSDVFLKPLQTVMLGYYGLRCGSAVSFTYDDVDFGHGACHQDDGLRALGSSEHVAATGGWHDAGDYGKYGVNAGFTVGTLLLAWQQFRPTLEALELPHIPEHGGKLPDFLAEVRYELDWLAKTQAPDGAVHHKLTAADFEAMILPEDDVSVRAFAPVSAEATAEFAGAMASAAVAFRGLDDAYADACKERAARARAWLHEHPDYPEVDLTGFTSGAYVTASADDRFWADVAGWVADGDGELLQRVEAQLPDVQSSPNWDWSNVENLGLFAYALSESEERNAELVLSVNERLLATADELVEDAATHGYGRAYSARYYWGSNGILARTMLNLGVAFELTGDARYRDAAQLQLDHLFGVNVFGRSQVTGLGYLPPRDPHHRPSLADRINPPWPGLLVGGPNGQDADGRSFDATVPAKAWTDANRDYWSNEVAINWNAPLVYGLSWFATP